MYCQCYSRLTDIPAQHHFTITINLCLHRDDLVNAAVVQECGSRRSPVEAAAALAADAATPEVAAAAACITKGRAMSAGKQGLNYNRSEQMHHCTAYHTCRQAPCQHACVRLFATHLQLQPPGFLPQLGLKFHTGVSNEKVAAIINQHNASNI